MTIYDERWRQVATYRINPARARSTPTPKSNSSITPLARAASAALPISITSFSATRTPTSGLASASRGGRPLLQDRIYYCQNWRADVVVLLDDEGAIRPRCSLLGLWRALRLPIGDVNADGVSNTTDQALVDGWISNGYDVRGDLDLDGDVDGADLAEVLAHDDEELGYGVLADRALRNRKGYAGYEGDSSLSAVWHVRHRVLESRLGRWLRRDPARFRRRCCVRTSCYVGGQALGAQDPAGLELIIL